VLSGYLITSILAGERGSRGSIDLRRFYVRRLRRLLPALVVLVVVVTGWAALEGELSTYLPGSLAALLYVGNWAYLDGQVTRGMSHVWSLAVEEQFYLVWPVLLGLVFGLGHRRTMVVVIALIALSYALTFATLGDEAYALYGSGQRVKELLLGAAIGLVSMHRGRDVSPSLALLLAAGALLALISTGATTTLAPVLTTIPAAVVLAWAAAHHTALSWRWLRWTGLISYGLYLYHGPLAFGPFNAFDGLSLWPRAVALTAATYLVATASWFGLERRFLRGRRDDARVLGAELVPAGVSGVHREHEPGRVVARP
jgi:peptidoglycan/LPS O-acetylase OafA/YrhL